MTLFPVSTISRSWPSSSAVHRRLIFFGPRIISPPGARTRARQFLGSFHQPYHPAPLYSIERKNNVIPPQRTSSAPSPIRNILASQFIAAPHNRTGINRGKMGLVPAGTTLKNLNWSFGPLRWFGLHGLGPEGPPDIPPGRGSWLLAIRRKNREIGHGKACRNRYCPPRV